MRGAVIVLVALLLAGAAPATGPCKPDLPDDTQLHCAPAGHVVVVSESAGQYMEFPDWRCKKATPT